MILILWILYAVWEGLREGRYWYYKNLNEKNKDDIVWVTDEHNLFTIQRATVLIGFTIAASNWWMILIGMLVFPFFHDGSYYHHRNKIQPNIYPKGWFDHSKKSTARLTKFFTPIVRTVCFLVGIVLAFILLNHGNN